MPRLEHAASVYKTSLYIYGGMYADVNRSIDQRPSLGDMWKLDLTTGIWTQVALPGASPQERAKVQSVVIGRYLYMFGGCDAVRRRCDHHGSDSVRRQVLRRGLLPGHVAVRPGQRAMGAAADAWTRSTSVHCWHAQALTGCVLWNSGPTGTTRRVLADRDPGEQHDHHGGRQRLGPERGWHTRPRARVQRRPGRRPR